VPELQGVRDDPDHRAACLLDEETKAREGQRLADELLTGAS